MCAVQECHRSRMTPSVCAGGHVCCSGAQAVVMQREMRQAEPFIIGCPACMNNFRNLFCSLFCSPDQSSFTNVTAAAMGSPESNRTKQVAVVKEVAFYLSEHFKNATYDSCKDVSFGAANSRAMTYIGNGALTAQVSSLHRHAFKRCIKTQLQIFVFLCRSSWTLSAPSRTRPCIILDHQSS